MKINIYRSAYCWWFSIVFVVIFWGQSNKQQTTGWSLTNMWQLWISREEKIFVNFQPRVVHFCLFSHHQSSSFLLQQTLVILSCFSKISFICWCFSKSTLINLILCHTVTFWCVNVLKINPLWWLKCETALLTFSPALFLTFFLKIKKLQTKTESTHAKCCTAVLCWGLCVTVTYQQFLLKMCFFPNKT